MAAAARTALIAALLTGLVLALVAMLRTGSGADQARKPQPTCSPISRLASPTFVCPL